MEAVVLLVFSLEPEDLLSLVLELGFTRRAALRVLAPSTLLGRDT